MISKDCKQQWYLYYSETIVPILKFFKRFAGECAWPVDVMFRYSIRHGSRILKWGVNFCTNVIEPKPG